MSKIIRLGTVLAICTICMTSMSACANNTQENESYSEGIKEFSVDNNTIKTDDNAGNSTSSSTSREDEYIFIPSELPQANVGTISLSGKDLSTDYTVSGDDIVYEGVTYQGLNKAVNSIRTPYDKVTFTNFIVKTFTPKSDKVFVTYINEEENTGWQASTTLDAELSMSWDGYNSIRDRYHSVAVWSLNLRDNGGKVADIIGNTDYMLQGTTNKDIVVDMSKYDTREDKSDTSSDEQSTVSKSENNTQSELESNTQSELESSNSDSESNSETSMNSESETNTETESAESSTINP